MNRLKKLMALILMGALVLCLALSLSSCGGGDEGNGGEGGSEGGSSDNGSGSGESGEPCNHFDLTGDGKCDACGEDYEEPFSEFELTVIAKDGEGNILPGVTVIVYESGYVIDSAPADANGSAVFTLPIGSYVVTLSDLPDYWTAGMKNIEGNEKQVSVSVIATDNTPDGSLAKPFFVGDEAQEFTVPALTTYNFFVKGMNRTLKVYGEGFKVYCEDNEYTDIEDGIMSVFVIGTDDPYSNTPFVIENLTEVPITVTVHFESAPGSQSNPITAELDTKYSPEIPREASVYYTYTATENGILTVSSDDGKNNIMLYNLTTLVATAFTGGNSSVSLEVNVDDVISVIVSHSDSSAIYTVDFTLSLSVGEDNSEK